jgi:hypothetical protein
MIDLVRTSLFILLLFTNGVFPLYSQAKNAEILLKHTICTIDKGELSVETRLRIAVYNRKGEDLVTFSLPFSHPKQIKTISGSITDKSGKTIRQLKKSEIKSTSNISDISLFENNYKKTFSLKHSSYPYTVEVNYINEFDEYYNIADWSPVYASRYKTKKAILELHVPKNFAFNLKEINIGSPPKISEDAGSKHYKWICKYDTVYEKEVYAPPLKSITSRIIITPVNFTYGIKGKQDTWTNFGQWKYNLTEGLQELPPSEKYVVDTLLRNCKSLHEKISKLYYYLQDNTRYISVQIDIGGFRPFTATYVAEKKYGDCKALSNYMLALLKYAGIKAYYTNIYADEENPPLIPQIPSQQFNHVIVFIPLENDSIWLDCTNDYTPTGFVSSFIQDRWALVIDSNNSKLVRTPSLKESDVCSITRYNYDLKTNGRDIVKISHKARGPEYEYLLTRLNNMTGKEQVEFINWMHYYFPDKKLVHYDYSTVARDSAGIMLSVEYDISNQIRKYGNDLICEINNLHIPDFEKPEKRKLPVWINYPRHSIDSIIYQFPDNTVSEHMPENLSISTAYGFYKLKVVPKTNGAIIIRSFLLKRGKYSLDEYPDFYAFIKNINQAERKNIISLKQPQ